MTEYAKHVMEKKQQEMKEEEQRKQAEDPDYVPKKPLSPTMPKKEKEDEKKAEKAPQNDKNPPLEVERSSFDDVSPLAFCLAPSASWMQEVAFDYALVVSTLVLHVSQVEGDQSARSKLYIKS